MPPFDRLTGNLMLAGAGKMGGALLEGWLALGLQPSNIAVIEPEPSDAIRALAARGLALNPRVRAGAAAVIVVAVKPQIARDVLPELAAATSASTLVVSIMAGRTLEFLGRLLPAATAIVRAMPNTPAAIGRGITVATANRHVNAHQRDLAQMLLSAVGAVEWANEDLMDAVTAVSGSGPAYVFLLVEALAAAGVAAGLPADLAGRLACATVAGAGAMLAASSLDATTLRQNVTSPGGTTAAALEVLMSERGLAPLLEKAVMAAAARSRELGG
ncbi:MAG: pyrroline-5-carboxylate reductase [Proteobacteria bacterium]|nr:pyrroline-5-carboxylate reductase [Pseudomonadota bacterium]